MPQTTVTSYSDPILDRWARFMRTRNLLYNIFRRDLAELGIKPEQLGILNIVNMAEGPVTPSFISRIYRREPHTVSVNLKRLEARGLIKLVKDMQRRNMIRVTITKAGEDVWERGIKKTDNVGLIFAELSPAESDQLDTIINKLAEASLRVAKRHK
ncbi:MarR family winged helix-turn-helix transcriptional regulator [Dehalogenimonas etheniformans]|nr:MarR family transcriptional regulator [Dehalogenimonas etheniformans]QNT75248.1 MarR family transcriptional regulator [Dehalogenimonas etheniformans]